MDSVKINNKNFDSDNNIGYSGDLVKSNTLSKSDACKNVNILMGVIPLIRVMPGKSKCYLIKLLSTK